MENGNTSSKTMVLIVATMAVFIVAFMGSAINIALPVIGKEFAMDAIMLSWVVTSSILATAAFLIPFGRIADIYGQKKIFFYGMLLFAISTLLASFSASAAMLISFRIVQGISMSMVLPAGVAILTSVFPPGERGKALGVNVAAIYIGLSLGPFLGGLLTEHLGWRSIFWVTTPLGLIVVVSILWKLKGEWAAAKGQRFDLGGSVIYTLAIAAIIYGLSTLPDTTGIWIILAGIVGMVAFVRWETRAPSPVLNMNLFRRNMVFAFSNLAALISYSATFAVAFLMSLYLQYIQGFSPQYAGFILVVTPAVQAIFSPVAGRLSDRIEPRIIASAGMALTTTALGLFIMLNQQTSLGFILASLVVLGLGFALFSSPNTNAIMSSVDKDNYGVASATVSAMRTIGMALSLGLVMLLFSLNIGRVEITPEYYPPFLTSVKTAFIIFTALCFGGIFASLARGKLR